MVEALPPLWLLRHGQTEWNREGRLQGWQDSPLTEQGEDQARLAAGRLAAQGLGAGDSVLRLVSPLGRAVATARLAFGDLPFETDKRLIEIGTGDWTGLHLKTLETNHPELFAQGPRVWYDAAPGAETFAGLARRIADFYGDLPTRAAGRSVVIITHGVTLRMLRALALGHTVEHETHIDFPQDAIHHIEAGRIRLV